MEDTKTILEQLKELPQIDRLTNLSLIWVGETLSLLMSNGDVQRINEFKRNIDRLFAEAAKAMMNVSANSN